MTLSMPNFNTMQEKAALAKGPVIWIAVGIFVGCIVFPIGSSMMSRGNTVVADGLSFTLTHGGSLLEVSVDDPRNPDSDDQSLLPSIIFPKPDKYWTIRHTDGSEWTLDGRDITGRPKDKPTTLSSSDLVYIDPGMVVSFPLGTHPHVGVLHLDATRITAGNAVPRDLSSASPEVHVWQGKAYMAIQ